MNNFCFLLALLSFSAFGGNPCEGASGKAHTNPDGSAGGFVASTAQVARSVVLDSSSTVCEQAKVQGNVKIKSGSIISGGASIEGNTEITSSRVYGSAKVYGKAQVVNSAVCQASDINFKVTNSDYYCQTDDPEPKHPGEAGKKTLLGIDSDADGVRDDIEIWINNRTSNTPNKDMYNERMALKQIAKKVQQNILVKDSEGDSRRLMLETFKALNCVKDISKSREDYVSITEDLRYQYFNTVERIKADFKMRSSLAGYSEELQERKKMSTCDFKLR